MDNEIRFHYDANSNLVERDVGGNASGRRVGTSFTYDRLNRRTRVRRQVDDDDDPLTPLADSNSNPIRVVDTLTGYDHEGRVTRVEEQPGGQPGGKTRRRAYDETSGFLTVSDYIGGGGVANELHRETRFDEADQRLWTRTYFDCDTDACDGQVVVYGEERFVYDEFGRLELTVRSPDTTDFSSTNNGAFYATRLSYDKEGNVTLRERGEDNSSADPLLTASYTYKRADKFIFDELRRVIEATSYQDYKRVGDNAPTDENDPVTRLTKHEYDGRTAIERKKLASGDADTTFTYDGASRLEDLTYPDGSRMAFVRDANGNVTEEHRIEQDGATTFKTWLYYDSLDRVGTSVVADDNGTGEPDLTKDYERTFFTYDARGNIDQVTRDVKGSTTDIVTDFDHDGLDRQVEATYDVGGIAIVNAVSYDDTLRTVTRTDGKTQDTVYTLDGARDVVTNIEYADHDAGSTDPQDWDNRWFAYDRAGRLTDEAFSEKDPPTSWDVTYSYDFLGRPTDRTNNVAGSGEEELARFTYDYQGRLLTAHTRLSSPSTEYDTEVVRTYNSLFLTRETQRIRDGGAWKEFTIRTDGGGGTGYDAGGRRVRIEYPNDADLDATGTTAERLLTFEYDGNDRLEKILDHPDPNDPGVTDTLGIYRYAGPGLRVEELDLHGDRNDPLNDPTEIEKTVAYDYLKRPTETEYRFTDTGEKRKYKETWGDGTWANSPDDTEWVGALRREGMEKVTVDSLGNETVELTHSYVYDALDRLVSFDSGATTFGYDLANNRSKKNDDTYNHNASNEITDIQDSAQQTLCTFTHDNRGNLTEKDCGTAESFAYDIFNRLVSYESTWEYIYDGLGRRVKKSDGVETHLYFHDGPSAILEVTGSEVREYIHGLGLDEVIMEEINSEIFWPLVDSLGTVRDLADLDGSGNARVRMEYDYTAYGEVQESDPTGTGLLAQDVLFTGRRLDRKSGIYYYRARHYDAELGRFLQRDPVGIWGDLSAIGNGYTYAAADPVNLTDSHGLQASPGTAATIFFKAKAALEDSAANSKTCAWCCQAKSFVQVKNDKNGKWIATLTCQVQGGEAAITVRRADGSSTRIECDCTKPATWVRGKFGKVTKVENIWKGWFGWKRECFEPGVFEPGKRENDERNNGRQRRGETGDSRSVFDVRKPTGRRPSMALQDWYTVATVAIGGSKPRDTVGILLQFRSGAYCSDEEVKSGNP